MLEYVINEIAPVILELVERYKSAQEADLKFYYSSTIKHLIRNLERFVTPRVSSEAQKRADELDIGDLSKRQWRDQTKGKMKGTRKSILHFEHVKPVGDMFNELASANPLIRLILMSSEMY